MLTILYNSILLKANSFNPAVDGLEIVSEHLSAIVLILSIVFDKLKTIIDFIQGLTSKSKIDNEMIKIILKITGISLLIEFAVSLCKDCKRE